MYRVFKSIQKNSSTNLPETIIHIDEHDISWIFTKYVSICCTKTKETRSSLTFVAYSIGSTVATFVIQKASFYEISEPNDTMMSIIEDFKPHFRQL